MPQVRRVARGATWLTEKANLPPAVSYGCCDAYAPLAAVRVSDIGRATFDGCKFIHNVAQSKGGGA